MALNLPSIKEYTGDGSTTDFVVPPHLEQNDISVYLDGVLKATPADYTFTTAGDEIRFGTAPANGVLVRTQRNSDLDARAVDFQDGSVLTEKDLDDSNIQVFYAAQEAIDKTTETMRVDADSKWDAQGNVIKNVGDPVNDDDAVNKDWAETAMSSQLAQAIVARTGAESAEANAEASENAAASSASSASTSASTATTKASEASTSATNAANSASSAATSATNAATSESNAASSASSASSSATSASTSASTATAQAAVATTKASEAASSATSATNSASTATTKASEASASANSAATSATSASNSATNAQTSATNAASSATSAGTSATSALSSKNAAATSETNAAASATAAASSETNAAASATSAAASAASAATLLDNFDDRYLGPKTSNPTVDNDGNALVVGALYFNSTANEMRVYTASGWVSASSASVETFNRYVFTATAGQTVFSGTDDNNNTLALTVGVEVVTLNGVVLEPTTDYTRTTSAITLTSGASVNDELNVIAFGNFTVADTVSRSNGGTFEGNVSVNGDLTVDANTFYVDSTNNRVGIGTTNPLQTLAVTAGGEENLEVFTGLSALNGGGLQYINRTSNSTRPDMNYYLAAGSGGAHKFYTEGAERLKVDSAGRVTMPYQPAFYAYHDIGIQSIPSHTAPLSQQNRIFASTHYNVGGHYSTSTGRFTAPVAGLYCFYAHQYTYSGDFNRLYIAVNDIPQVYTANPPIGYDHTVTAKVYVKLNAGDYVNYRHNVSGTCNYFSAFNHTFFTGFLVG